MIEEIRKINWDDPALAGYESPLALSSEIWAWYVDGVFGVAWGIIPVSLLSQEAYVWSVSSPTILRRYPRAFLCRTREVIALMHQDHPILFGHTDCKTAWLRHIGAEFGEQQNGLTRFTIKVRND